MIRIGHSKDIHQLKENRKLVLGGVEIDYEKGLYGHSDADVLVHAIVESIIGGLAEGDIGTFFPDDDLKYKDSNSMDFFLTVKELLKEKKYNINNIDATIFAEKPKMAQHIPKMRSTIAIALDIDVSQINIKATRGEKMGPIGKGEGIAAEAVVLMSND